MIAATHFEWQIVREQIGDRKKLTIECDPMLTFALAPVIAFESLSGHSPRSWLRSSDLLPFYHQYPAACCGDFLFDRRDVLRRLFRGARERWVEHREHLRCGEDVGFHEIHPVGFAAQRVHGTGEPDPIEKFLLAGIL